jgi:diacylglycerol O-acyltransferase / wax synthase
MKLVTTFPNAIQAMASVAMPALGQMGTMPKLTLPDFSKPNMGLPNVMDPAAGLSNALGFGPRTPLNVSITNQRAFAGRSVPLAETKALAKRMGVSLNDIVMAACSGALRRYMHDLNVPLDKSMTAAVPVSLREAGNTDPNNQVTMMLASLATDLKDPLERLKAIHASTTSSKELTGNLKAAIPTDFPSFGAPWVMTGLATLFGRSKISDQIPPIANVAISNVPGVPVMLYVAGAQMTAYFPVSIPCHGCALNITVQSYNGSLDYGLTACRRAVPDVDELANYIVQAHAELKKLILALDGPPGAKSDAKAAASAQQSPIAHTVATHVVPAPAAPTPQLPQQMAVAMPARAPMALETSLKTTEVKPVSKGKSANGKAKSKSATTTVKSNGAAKKPAAPAKPTVRTVAAPITMAVLKSKSRPSDGKKLGGHAAAHKPTATVRARSTKATKRK